MANIFVRSTDGNDADSGATWALAKATLTGAAAIDAAGDVIWVSQAHAESTAAALSFSWQGNQGNPTRVICGNDAAEPPTAQASSATVTTTGDNGITAVNDEHAYVSGITFIAGSGGTATANITLTANGGLPLETTYETCSFQLASTGTGSQISCATNNLATIYLKDCTFKFAAAAQRLGSIGGNKLHISGGSVLAGSSAITEFIGMGNSAEVYIDGFDFSNCAASMNVTASGSSNYRLIVRNCKMPASWSGSVVSGTPAQGTIAELYNCDSGDTNYRYERKTAWGTITHETTIVRTGGASDGTTPLSWKMVSNTNPEWKHQTLNSGEIVRWNETTGSPITVTVEFVHDSLTNMTDREIWLEVQYLGTSGNPLALFIDDAAADYVTTAADQTDSSAAWTTTGLTNPNTQKMSVTFTPQEKGFIHAVVKVAAASKTVYVDPMLTVA